MMDFYTLALIFIGVSTVGSLIRVVIGPTIWDRLLGIGLGASKITLAVVIRGLALSESYIFDLALLFSVLGFLVTVLLARFIERRGEI
ncbi:MAG: monovalent cation/H+ antiporter complex subunit F [Alkalispirochaetaceae bacterium]